MKGTPLGNGRKLDLYLAPENIWIIDAVERRITKLVKSTGTKPSFNAVFVGAVKAGLAYYSQKP